jgi:hypothetical protein
VFTLLLHGSLGHRAKYLGMRSPFLVHSQRLICFVSSRFVPSRPLISNHPLLAAAIDYLDSGKVRVAGIVNKTYKLEQWADCLAAMKDKSAIKAAIVFD